MKFKRLHGRGKRIGTNRDKRFHADRLALAQKGFRARISRHWYVFDRLKAGPVAGPMSQAEANAEAKRLNRQPPSPTDAGEHASTAMESPNMSDNEKATAGEPADARTETKETTERTETTEERTETAAAEEKQ